VVVLRTKAQIKWQKTGGSVAMKTYLDAYKARKATAIKRIYGGVTPEQMEKTEISLRCGTSPANSYFIFVEGAGNTSQLVGFCPSNRLDHLLHDFNYLIDQMNLSDIKFKISDVQIQINDERLIKKSPFDYIHKRSVLVDLISMAGLIPLISAGLLNILTSDLIYPTSVGLILWFVTIIIGYWSEPKYALR